MLLAFISSYRWTISYLLLYVPTVKKTKKKVEPKVEQRQSESGSATMKLMFERHHEGPVSIVECPPNGVYVMLQNSGSKVCSVCVSA